MSLFEGSNILVSSTNYSYMGQIYLEEGELFDVVFPIPSQFKISDPITATIYHRNGILTFQSTVVGTIDDRILLVKPSRDTSLLNRREHPRYDLNLPGKVVISSTELSTTIKDLSVTGLKFVSEQSFEEGTELNVTIDADLQLSLKCIVRRVVLREGLYSVGVEFVHKDKLSTNIQDYLKRYESLMPPK